MVNFHGVKIALFYEDKVISIQRDDKLGLRWANMWDFPGGKREDGETPFECVSREVYEELGIDLPPEAVVWEKMYPAMHDPNIQAIFMVANITKEQIDSIKFGDEGQGWKLMNISDFLKDDLVIEPLKGRINDYLLLNLSNKKPSRTA